jgi:hypothetical protein
LTAARGSGCELIWSINFYGQGTGQGYAIDNLKFSASAAPESVTIPTLKAVSYSGAAAGTGFKLSFSDSPGASGQFTVWSATKLTFCSPIAGRPTCPALLSRHLAMMR